jgi:uncharacterized protein YbjT (DUF2867 family)
MHALIVGATGASGSDLLDLLLQDPYFARVDIFVRREPGIRHEKLRVHVVRFGHPEEWGHLVKGDVLFSCLGTTLKAAGSKQAQWKIDYDYQYEFALEAKKNKVSSYVLISAGFASQDSIFFYSRLKGRLEHAVKALGFRFTAIFKPPLLIRKGTDRKGEIMGEKIMKALNHLGLFRAQRPLPTRMLAQAMINTVKTKDSGSRTYGAEDIWRLAQS